jgi:hypothetical protein
LTGAQGLQGPAGPAGPAGTSIGESLSIVDQNGQDVGLASEPFSGLLLRRVGNDAIVFFAAVSGIATAPIDFYHTKADCSDGRYITITGGSGFAYYASVRGGTAFYTKSVDMSGMPADPIVAVEHFEPNEDATLTGVCMAASDPGAVGPLTTANDPALAHLALPLRLK